MNSFNWSIEILVLLRVVCVKTFLYLNSLIFMNVYNPKNMPPSLLHVFLHYYLIVLILLTVVEQVEKSASVYSKSMQGHHICLLVKMVRHGN